jgi:hypothetical protein
MNVATAFAVADIEALGVLAIDPRGEVEITAVLIGPGEGFDAALNMLANFDPVAVNDRLAKYLHRRVACRHCCLRVKKSW